MNDPTNTPERYRIKWPEGTRVFDTRAGISFVAEAGRLSYAGDDEIFRIAMAQTSVEAEANEPNASVPSHVADEPPDDVNTLQTQSPNLPLGDVVSSKEPQRFFLGFRKFAGIVIVALFAVTLVSHKRRRRRSGC